MNNIIINILFFMKQYNEHKENKENKDKKLKTYRYNYIL